MYVFEIDILKTVLESISPSETTVLYQPGATFDKHYNSHFKPYNFVPPPDVKKVSVRVQYIYIITGIYFYSYHLCLYVECMYLHMWYMKMVTFLISNLARTCQTVKTNVP